MDYDWLCHTEKRKEVENLEMIKIDHTLKFECIEETAKGGIYTTEDIDEGRRNILYLVR